ncbi:MAG: SDR family oxidoreductase [Candidatus Nanohalobium sp.]
MKHLVAGKGFIGSSLGEKLDGEVKYLDRSGADYNFDITEEFEIRESFDTVYHCIGLAPGFATREKYHAVHVEGTRNLLNAVNADKIVYVSALNPEPDHSFFNTKQEAEKLVKESDIAYTVLRPSTVTGGGNRLLDLMRKASVTRMFPDLPTRTQPIALEDFVDCLAKVSDSRNGEVLNIAGPEKMEMFELAERIYREEGRRCFRLPLPEGFPEAFLNLVGIANVPPFTRENSVLVTADNTTDENHAPQLTQLQKAL